MNLLSNAYFRKLVLGMFIMNILPTAAAAIFWEPCEGMSVRATCRLTGTAKERC